ncbi:MAG TPA: hypothetical protein VN848_07840 [Gemmatimonadales bacterium]|nr:hypothetical protein [Gemmatimonadales bacterium]
MTFRWLSALAFASLAALSCGAGNAIFDVDVASFIQSSSADTIPYVVPPFVSNFAVSNVPQKISLVPGAGGSAVDTVTIVGTTNFVNTTGSGSIAFQIYVAGDSASTYSAGAAIFVPPGIAANVSPNTTTPVPIPTTNLAATLDSIFTKSAVWFRMVATVSNAGATVVQGHAVIAALNLRVVVNPKLF